MRGAVVGGGYRAALVGRKRARLEREDRTAASLGYLDRGGGSENAVYDGQRDRRTARGRRLTESDRAGAGGVGAEAGGVAGERGYGDWRDEGDGGRFGAAVIGGRQGCGLVAGNCRGGGAVCCDGRA